MNWAAIAVATLVPTVIGAIWYNPKVLGNYWLRANNSTAEAMRRSNMPLIFLGGIVLSFFLAMFVHQNVTGVGQEAERYGTFQHGMVHGTALTIMMVLPILGTGAMFERRSWSWLFVNLGYWWVALMVMGGILSLWR
ncbi:MAG: DUF1761 domain-containing protein [Saprospiraceae bacterium]